ncbi:MAG TPA: hypothetical protein VFU37_19910, partial [Pyrinomonadaceae bacterium]|nr:hypothetical protein [Pyrinomonadaceae bacterium]
KDRRIEGLTPSSFSSDSVCAALPPTPKSETGPSAPNPGPPPDKLVVPGHNEFFDPTDVDSATRHST